jgi:hypothetical protein
MKNVTFSLDPGVLSAAVKEAARAAAHAPEHLQPAIAAELVRVLLTAERGASSSSRDAVASPTRERSASDTLVELLARIGDASHPDRLVAIAAFRFNEGTDVLSAEDFRAAYGEARIPAPQNLSANLSRCMRRGWLVQATSKDGIRGWRITQTGLKYARSLEES